MPTVISKTSGMPESSILGNVLFAQLVLPVHAERIIARARKIPNIRKVRHIGHGCYG